MPMERRCRFSGSWGACRVFVSQNSAQYECAELLRFLLHALARRDILSLLGMLAMKSTAHMDLIADVFQWIAVVKVTPLQLPSLEAGGA